MVLQQLNEYVTRNRTGEHTGVRSRLATLQSFKLLRYAVSVLLLVLWLVPLLGLLYISLKPINQLISEPFWNVPNAIVFWSNLQTAWIDGHFQAYALNTVIYATVGAGLAVILASMAGFAAAKMDLPGGDKLFYVFFLFASFSHQQYLIPLVKMSNWLNVYNTRTGLLIVYIAVATPFAVYLMRNYYMTLPSSLYEAARIDGLSKFQIYRNIYLPLARPGLAVGFIFQWVFIWNNLAFGLVLSNSATARPIAAGLISLTGRSPRWSVLAAATLISVIPPIVIFVTFQRYFVQGLLAGTKG